MLSLSLPDVGEHVGGGARGEIEVFSPESRYRLFRCLHQLKFKRVTFVTLTYPGEFPTDPRVYKGHLKEYRRRFEAKYGKVQAVWRLEFQERGAPHFHIFYLDCPFIEIGEWCWLWKCVTHTWDMAHELLGVDVKLVVEGGEQGLIASYVGKYVAKIDERSQNGRSEKCGRWWGRWNIDEEDPIEIEISDREASLVTSWVLSLGRSGASWEPRDPTVCTLFGNSMGGNEFSRRVQGLLAGIEKSKRG